MVYYKSCCLVQVISDLIMAFCCELHLLISDAFDTLFMFNRLQLSFTLIEPLINRFDWFTIHNKGCPIGINTSCEILYSQINTKSIVIFNFYRFWFYFADKFNLKISSVVFWVNSNFLNLIDVKSFRECGRLADILTEAERFWMDAIDK